MTDWERVCVLCAARGRSTRVETGHCCTTCAGWLMTTVADIARLAADASAFLAPGSARSGGSRPVPGSRPPLTVDALDPELTPVPVAGQPPHVWPTVLEVLEGWERLVRAERDMQPYGPASTARIPQILARAAANGISPEAKGKETLVTLIGCTSFLGSQVAWMTTEPEFPLDDFADEMRACARVLRRWDLDAEASGQVIPCPTVYDDGDCGTRLRYRDMDEQVTCRRCGVTRDVPQLLLVANADNAMVDADALSERFGIDPSTIRRWARSGRVERNGQRYRYGDVRAMVETRRSG